MDKKGIDQVAKLPLHPFIFVPAYLLLVCLATFPMIAAQHYALIWAAVGVVGALGLQVVWALRALVFVSKKHTDDGRASRLIRLTTAKLGVFALVICLAIVTLYQGYLRWHVSSMASIAVALKLLSSVCEGLAVVLFFSTFWISAAGICNVEEGGKAPAHRVVGTFLLLVYLFVGAPFIFARLKRLAR